VLYIHHSHLIWHSSLALFSLGAPETDLRIKIERVIKVLISDIGLYEKGKKRHIPNKIGTACFLNLY
jgi:hypothetical protein